MKNVPEEIYLCLGPDWDQIENFDDLAEVTWCRDRIDEGDLVYHLAYGRDRERTLQDVFDMQDYGLYALWVKAHLPDLDDYTDLLDDYTDVTGIQHCTVLITARDGVLNGPDWLHRYDPEEIQAKWLDDF